jgi:phosphoribosylaminoimidazole-succinocarboxamide synthase
MALVERGLKCYEGKAKTVYQTADENHYILHFRDDISAFNGVKREQLLGKGRVNNLLNAHIMHFLGEQGVPTHFESVLSPDESLVKRLEMLPVECVIRNRAAGSLCKRFGIPKGQVFDPPLFEFFLKNDALNDPLVTEEHLLTFGWANPIEIQQMRGYTHTVNQLLLPWFADQGLILVDFKLEFGWFEGTLCLGDEFTPDGCRIWDLQTGKVLDKDRFRQDLGEVVAGYEEVAHRLGVWVEDRGDDLSGVGVGYHRPG